MKKQTIRDVDFSGKRVLMRVDFNVPVQNGEVQDTTRITAALPTIRTILKDNPRAVILTSHLGRPGGEPDPSLSLKPVAPVLADLLGQDVAFAEDCIGDVAEKAIADLPDGGVILLENTRFHPGEKKNHADFAEKLAAHGDIFVNDAFGTAHRAHASNVGVAEHLPAVAGLLMEKEITYLNNAIEDPQRPFVAILGGAKVSDKINVIEALLGKVDRLLIGGGMANTFFAAQGIETADSLVEEDAIDKAKALLETGGDKLFLPVDARIADAFDNDANMKVISISGGVPDGWRILDIGPDTIQTFKDALAGAQTIVWNGPMGVFEMSNFSHGTFEIAEALAEAADSGTNSIIGGGDSAAAAEQSGLADRITHISTGGGASLEMLEGNTLPGLAALADK
jgi:phosphoglycerate kinase